MASPAPHHSDAHDAQLVLRAQGGDREAFTELFRRHAPPAWRLALAVGASTDVATHSVARGYTLSLIRLQRGTTTLAVPFRHLVVRAAGELAATATRRDEAPIDVAPNELADAFFALPERWRAALWLTLVEGGTPAQVAPIIGLSEEGTASLVDRAGAGLRVRYARSTPLAAYLLRDLDDAKPKLQAIAVPMPSTIQDAAVHQWRAWQASVARDKRHGLATVVPLRPWAERAVSAAAAVVFAAGIATAINLGAKSARRDAPTLASSAGRVETAAAVSKAVPVRTARGVSLHQVHGIARHHAVARGTAPPAGAAAMNVTTAASNVATATPANPDTGRGTVEDTSTSAPPSADAGTTVAGTPVAITVGTDGAGITVGPTTVGNAPPPAPNDGVSVTVSPGNGVAPIGITIP